MLRACLVLLKAAAGALGLLIILSVLLVLSGNVSIGIRTGGNMYADEEGGEIWLLCALFVAELIVLFLLFFLSRRASNRR